MRSQLLSTSALLHNIFILLLVQSLPSANGQGPTPTLQESCLAVVRDIFLEEKKELLCQTPSGMFYIVPTVDNQWINQKMLSGELISGEVYMNLPSGTKVDRATETLLLTEPPTLFSKEDDDASRRLQRKLARVTGDKTVLVVRISATNGQVSVNEDDLSKAVFGGSNDFVNLKSQYSACSHGKLKFVKKPNSSGLTVSVRNGVVTIRVNVPVQVGQMTIVNEVTKTLEEEFGTSFAGIADHVMYCLPRGAWNGVGYAVMNGELSVYNDDLCTSVSAQMHEVG